MTGEVYHASDIIGGGNVVVKLQYITGTITSLEHEYNVLRQLGDTIGIPHVHWFGWKDNYDALVLDHLGQSLESVFKTYQYSFSRNTIVLIGYQLVSISYIACTDLTISLGLPPPVHSLKTLHSSRLEA